MQLNYVKNMQECHLISVFSTFALICEPFHLMSEPRLCEDKTVELFLNNGLGMTQTFKYSMA